MAEVCWNTVTEDERIWQQEGGREVLVSGWGGQTATHRWSPSGERTMEAGKTGSDEDKHEPKTDGVSQNIFLSAHLEQPQSVER